MTRTGLMGLFLAMLLVAGGCIAPADSSQVRLSANPDMSITILGSPQEEYVRGMARAFELETGIRATYVRKSAGEALDLLRATRDKPEFTVWWGGPAEGYIAAADEGLLDEYRPRGVNKVPNRYKDANGRWTGIYVGALAFAVNTRVLKDSGLPEPASWADLVKPAYQGLVSMAHPATSGTAFTTIATVLQLNGRDLPRGFEYLSALHKNVKSYERQGAMPARVAGRGDVAVAIAFAHDIVVTINEGSADLKLVFPTEGTGFEIGAMGLVKDGPDQEAGRRFLDWAMTERAQELGPLFGAYQIPTNPDAKVPQQSVRLSSVNAIDYDFNWAGENRDRLVDRFTKDVAPVPPEQP
ncbi:MAG: ABC transporter substrate-binding protein [Chloroflexota bacterium]